MAPSELKRVRGHRVTRRRLHQIYGRKVEWNRPGVPRILSYGGGVDSFAMLVGAIARGEPPTHVVFADVTDPRSVSRLLAGKEPREELGEAPGEWPGTYRHLVEVAIPLMEREGIPFHWLTTETPGRNWPWRQYAHRIPILAGERTFGQNYEYSSLIGMYEDTRTMFTTTHIGGRVCTNAAKVRRIGRWVRSVWERDQPLEMWIGFDADEERRIQQEVTYTKKSTDLPGRELRYPLIEWGVCRCRCVELIRGTGLPVPRKSACSFCGLQKRRDWRTLAAQQPETFARAERVERRFKGTGADKMLLYSGESYPRGERGRTKRLRVWMEGTTSRTRGVSKTKLEGCTICGAEVKATKAAGVGWLDEPTPEELMDPRPGARALVGLPPMPVGQMELLPAAPPESPDQPVGMDEEELVAQFFSDMLRDENPAGLPLHLLLTA